MNRFILFLGLIGLTSLVHAWNPPDATFGLTSDTRQVSISSTTASPTQICVRDSFVQRTWIINSSTFSIFLSTVSTGLSTSSSFAIPGVNAGESPVIWSPDGVSSPWNGPLYAITNPTASTLPKISVFRSK
jgi:hypothetical protein